MKKQSTYLIITLLLFITYLALIPAVFSLSGEYFYAEILVLIGTIVLGVFGMINFESQKGWQTFYALFFIILLNQIVLAINGSANWIVSLAGIVGFALTIVHQNEGMKKHKVKIIDVEKKATKKKARKAKKRK